MTMGIGYRFCLWCLDEKELKSETSKDYFNELFINFDNNTTVMSC